MSGLSALILAARIADLTDTWLEVRCCRGGAFLPLRRLAMDHGGGWSVREVVGPLRCRHCRAHPALVALVGDPAGSAPGRAGAPPGWRVVLVRDPLARTMHLGGGINQPRGQAVVMPPNCHPTAGTQAPR